MLSFITFTDRTVLFEAVCCTYLNASMYSYKYNFYWCLSNIFERCASVCPSVTRWGLLQLSGAKSPSEQDLMGTERILRANRYLSNFLYVFITEQILLCMHTYVLLQMLSGLGLEKMSFCGWCLSPQRSCASARALWACGAGIAPSPSTWWGFCYLASGKGAVNESFCLGGSSSV